MNDTQPQLISSQPEIVIEDTSTSQTENLTPNNSANTAASTIPSSPPRPRKERRNPSITPRKFQRFFTPRSRIPSKPSAARKALCDLTAPALNRCQTPSSPLKPVSEDQNSPQLPEDSRNVDDDHRGKRRKIHHTPDKESSLLPSPLNSSPLLPTPELKEGPSSPLRSLRARRGVEDEAESDRSDSENEDEEDVLVRRPTPLYRRGMAGQLVQRMMGAMRFAGERPLQCPVIDWRMETADWYSKPEDTHFSSSHEGAPRAIPFCTTGCNKNSLVAVGDEEGYVRFLDSDGEFSQIFLSFQAHGNAIIDMAFSEDDYLLATASGDQTGRVIDVMAQKPISVLSHHTASLKQIRFQPGRGASCVLATSGRDGSIQIWDLRCRGGPVQDVTIVPETGLHHRLPKPPNPGCVVNSIDRAHAIPPHSRNSKGQQPSNSGDAPRLGEVLNRNGEVSVTALQFLPPGQEHLLLSACEADASIRLWDIRAVHTSRHSRTSTPVSCTPPPPSHVSFRPFGICSMALNNEGTRLYTLCKDNTVYAYSTAHLVLGHATELTPALPGAEPPRRRHHPHGLPHRGLAPLYGFRHPLFHATSFYVKAAIRPVSNGRSELLAVGSSDACAVLFPTDERYIREAWLSSGADPEPYYVGTPTACLPNQSSSRPGLRSHTAALARSNSFLSQQQAANKSVPIVTLGTPLVRGHTKEVGAVAWTCGGERLVTVGDDFIVRLWSEDREVARDLRTGGETGGRRWGCGWADVGDAWDGDEDDW